ncbi:SixA phosphatase family protein [Aureimonas phyllosphaerae]|uniref:Phosphohistidine phosphatase n=1 Tax=Aureimonas phyllosphaerae TaxID=1166078 RepID=A0A7W6BUB9_9HYPH|nr:histidine phosphatase family protein [Aureimonas phyllosphaerae]MBB3935218.1 phosphohistidine phosphatase [Aureimonas phyllosphaerae]MBB3959226.1 phosphohistidine phosphatase [Aureimonas phyllosphaerae]SFF06227.1 phosphohistidine phosphatase [Aureimonas phyllosphaerae]
MTSERTVHILRHAHSSWAVPGQRDHQRVLDDRGRADAVRMAEEAHAIGSRVGMVVCSTAVRARQTLDLFRRALPQDVPVRFSDELYALGRAAYVGEIDAFAGPGELLLVGHNPTIEDLALHLCEGDETSQRLLRSGVGTSNWLTIDLNAGTSQRGRLRVLLKP